MLRWIKLYIYVAAILNSWCLYFVLAARVTEQFISKAFLSTYAAIADEEENLFMKIIQDDNNGHR